MWTRQRFAAGALLTRGKDARQNAVKLVDRQILADVTISSSAQGGMHPLFVVSNAGEDDNRHVLTHLPDETDQRDAINFRHIQIDYHDITLMVLEPSRGLETFGEVFAGVAFLLEIRDKKFRDRRVIIDKEKFGGIPGQHFHSAAVFHNYYN